MTGETSKLTLSEAQASRRQLLTELRSKDALSLTDVRQVLKNDFDVISTQHPTRLREYTSRDLLIAQAEFDLHSIYDYTFFYLLDRRNAALQKSDQPEMALYSRCIDTLMQQPLLPFYKELDSYVYGYMLNVPAELGYQGDDLAHLAQALVKRNVSQFHPEIIPPLDSNTSAMLDEAYQKPVFGGNVHKLITFQWLSRKMINSQSKFDIDDVYSILDMYRIDLENSTQVLSPSQMIFVNPTTTAATFMKEVVQNKGDDRSEGLSVLMNIILDTAELKDSHLYQIYGVALSRLIVEKIFPNTPQKDLLATYEATIRKIHQKIANLGKKARINADPEEKTDQEKGIDALKCTLKALEYNCLKYAFGVPQAELQIASQKFHSVFIESKNKRKETK